MPLALLFCSKLYFFLLFLLISKTHRAKISETHYTQQISDFLGRFFTAPFIVVFVCCCIVSVIIFLNRQTSLFDEHGDLISIIISAVCVAFFVVFGTDISSAIKQKKECLAEKLLLYRIKTGKIEDFFDLICTLEDNINALEMRKAEKQKQIADKLENNQ